MNADVRRKAGNQKGKAVPATAGDCIVKEPLGFDGLGLSNQFVYDVYLMVRVSPFARLLESYGFLEL